MEIKNIKVKDVLIELGKLNNDEVKQFVDDSKFPHNVPENSIVREIVEKIYGEYTISRMIIVRAYLADIILGREPAE
jgi:polyhydroxyalkanoate synthesis regulator phasin